MNKILILLFFFLIFSCKKDYCKSEEDIGGFKFCVKNKGEVLNFTFNDTKYFSQDVAVLGLAYIMHKYDLQPQRIEIRLINENTPIDTSINIGNLARDIIPIKKLYNDDVFKQVSLYLLDSFSSREYAMINSLIQINNSSYGYYKEDEDCVKSFITFFVCSYTGDADIELFKESAYLAVLHLFRAKYLQGKEEFQEENINDSDVFKVKRLFSLLEPEIPIDEIITELKTDLESGKMR